MTIASEITRIGVNISNAYSVCNSKGATMPVTQNSANLATCISSISGGSAPTLVTKSITQNGTYNASSDSADGYSSVTVNVSGGGSVIPREISNGVYQIPSTLSSWTLPSTITEISDGAMSGAFYGCTTLTSADLSSLITVSGNHAMSNMFTNNTNLASVDLSNLTTLSGDYAMSYAFNYTGLTSVDLSDLTTISGNYAMQGAFDHATSLASVNLSGLTTISGSNAMYAAFKNCALTSVTFSSLSTLSGQSALINAFMSCSSLSTLSFPALKSTSFGSYTTQFQSMLSGVTGCTVHFPSNLQSVIGSWSSVTGGFGGTNTTVLFDLTATT